MPSLEQTSNKYTDRYKELGAQQDVILKKVQANAKKMKDGLAQMQLGDDSKVDEAIMISFFASLYDDITKAYRAYQEFRLERKAENLEKEKGILQQKIDNIKEFKEQSERIAKYTRLNIEKTLHEQKIKDPGTSESDKTKSEKSLTQIAKDMDEIADFYGYATNENFMDELEASEKIWFGESAELLKELREGSPEALGDLLGEGVDVGALLTNPEMGAEMVDKVTKMIVNCEVGAFLQEAMTETETEKDRAPAQDLV